MAAKMIVMKLLQEIRGFAEITDRRPPPRSPGLFLMQLRSHTPHTPLPSRKRSIAVEMQNLPEFPTSVKIIHFSQSPTSAARLAAH